jgi:hypothetical protein
LVKGVMRRQSHQETMVAKNKERGVGKREPTCSCWAAVEVEGVEEGARQAFGWAEVLGRNKVRAVSKGILVETPESITEQLEIGFNPSQTSAHLLRLTACALNRPRRSHINVFF